MCKILNDFGAGDRPTSTRLGAAPHIWRHVHGREQAEITLVNGYDRRFYKEHTQLSSPFAG